MKSCHVYTSPPLPQLRRDSGTEKLARAYTARRPAPAAWTSACDSGASCQPRPIQFSAACRRPVCAARRACVAAHVVHCCYGRGRAVRRFGAGALRRSSRLRWRMLWRTNQAVQERCAALRTSRMSFSMSIASSNCLHAERSLSAWMHPAAIPCAGSFQRATGWAAHQAQTHARTHEHAHTHARMHARTASHSCAQILTRARSRAHARAQRGGRRAHLPCSSHRPSPRTCSRAQALHCNSRAHSHLGPPPLTSIPTKAPFPYLLGRKIDIDGCYTPSVMAHARCTLPGVRWMTGVRRREYARVKQVAAIVIRERRLVVLNDAEKRAEPANTPPCATGARSCGQERMVGRGCVAAAAHVA